MSIAPAPAAMPLTAAMIGFFKLLHVLYDIAGHAREFVKLVAFHLEQRPDDVVDPAAGTKSLAGSREHNHLDGMDRGPIPP